MWPFKRNLPSQAEQEITRSIKALKTLTFIDGRVSIAPQEVLSQPGYLEARAQAAGLIRAGAPPQRSSQTCRRPSSIGSLVVLIDQLQSEGMSRREAIDTLCARLQELLDE